MQSINVNFTAYHEAGHAAVRLYFDMDVESVSIVPNDASDGRVTIDCSGDEALRFEDDGDKQVYFERQVMSAFAGEIAQRRYAPESWLSEHGESDRALALRYLEELDTPTAEILSAYVHLLELRTASLVVRLWPRIERIASALIAQGALTAEQARAAFIDPAVNKLVQES